jgi:hypothetical protein
VQKNELLHRKKVTSKKSRESLLRYKKVVWYEHLLEVIHGAHLHLPHAKDSRSYKTYIDQMWWGITEDTIKLYRGICPECL